MAPDPLAEHEAWERWVTMVDDDVKTQAAELLSKYDVTESTGMVQYLQALTMLLLKGHYSPIVINTAHTLIKDMLSVLYMKHQESGVTGSFSASVRQVMTEIRQVRQTTPSYITAQPEAPALPEIDYVERD